MKRIALLFTVLALVGQLTILALRLRPAMKYMRRLMAIRPEAVAILKELRAIRSALNN